MENFNFKMKAIYLALMVRRIIEAQNDPTVVDDRLVKRFLGSQKIPESKMSLKEVVSCSVSSKICWF